MELLPAHQPLLEDDTDEEMSDAQMRELLNEAAIRMRAKAAGKPTATPNVPFRLPKLRPGHLADTHEKTEGNITRLDHAKLVDKKQQALANGIKKIDDPLAIKKKKLEVRSNFSNTFLDGRVWYRLAGATCVTLLECIQLRMSNRLDDCHTRPSCVSSLPLMIIIPILY
jgi:hypothetical protein